MDSRPKLRRLLHDVQGKCTSLKSASLLLKDCPPEKARAMVALMTQEARDILKCLGELDKGIDPRPQEG